MFLLYYPLKQGLKLAISRVLVMKRHSVFTLLSIKTRIETSPQGLTSKSRLTFLLYYPLKQGLKLLNFQITRFSSPGFLLYYPLKQGLKPDHHPQKKDSKQFLLYYPLKQGLKLTQIDTSHLPTAVFTLLSIKTRIETYDDISLCSHAYRFYSTIH